LSHRARKRFGQNFLHDQSVIERILSHIDPQPGQRLVEIGPGKGALTRGLLERAGELDAVELDRDLLQPLQRSCAAFGALRLHNTDALKFDFRGLRDDERRLRLVGNLPYNISTPLLFHLVEQAEAIEDMHFMLQVSCEVTPLFDIGPESFDPPPKVNSSVVRLRPRPEPLVATAEMQTFGKLVTAAFHQRRKTLRNNLKGLLDSEQIMALGIDPGVRTETLSLQDLIRLHQAADRSLG
jgi:16S rRNA (adenine1518-N6/adenine1519-N6)-dimethyltransferase